MPVELEEIDEYVLKQQAILTEISDLENTSLTTLKAKIQRLREVTRPLVEAGYYPDKKLGHLCSIIREQLKPYNIASVEQRAGWYYDLFEEEERDKRDNMSQNISSTNRLPIEKQTGIDEIDKLKEYARNSEPLPDEYLIGNIFKLINETCNETHKQSESLTRKLEYAFYFTKKFDERYPDKRKLETELNSTSGKKTRDLVELYNLYNEHENTIQSIEGELSDHKMLESLKETLATQKFISKQIDERSKITFLEKWNAIIAEIEIGVSAIAKKLGVNKKHLTNNVRPKQNPVTGSKNMHHNYIDWFRHISIVTPTGETYIFDAKAYFDKQLERGKLNVPFETLILKNCDVK